MKNLREFKTIRERREALEKETGVNLKHAGNFSIDEMLAASRNCENMIGVTQIPLGIAGPLLIRGKKNLYPYYIPLATTEGALVASVNRGCKAISQSGGAVVVSQRVGATRGPVFYTGSIVKGHEFLNWLEIHIDALKKIAASTSSHLKLTKSDATVVGSYAYVRFYFDTQDAMGMNMVTIATQKMAEWILTETATECISVSGNFCTDKKVSWQNFINGRGIQVWAEVTIAAEVLSETLKTSAEAIYRVWLSKCMVGSAISGSVGFNAQAANVIGALFLATGQDAGHIGEGSMAVTTTEVVTGDKQKAISDKSDLRISVYIPDLMVGTVGGGTGLATQQETLKLLGVAGGNDGKNAQKLAEIIGAAVLAGELSLLASLSQGTLAKAHIILARGKG